MRNVEDPPYQRLEKVGRWPGGWREKGQFLQFLLTSTCILVLVATLISLSVGLPLQPLMNVLAEWVRPPVLITDILLYPALLVLDILHYRRERSVNGFRRRESGQCLIWDGDDGVISSSPGEAEVVVVRCSVPQQWGQARRACLNGTLSSGAWLLILRLLQLKGYVGPESDAPIDHITKLLILLCSLHAGVLAVICVGLLLLNRKSEHRR